MEKFEEKIQKAIEDRVVANAVVAGYTAPDSLYTKAFGKKNLEATAADVELDGVFWIASCTKLLTTIAALQCVERGLVTLDEPISRILPEYSSPSIITGLDPVTQEPVLEAAREKMTLRHLLTHTSGMGYAMMSPLLYKWSQWEGKSVSSSSPAGNESEEEKEELKPYLLPLTFEPGSKGNWQYGLSLDWAGFVVERLNGGVRLGTYMQEHIFTPLGMTSSTFHPRSAPGGIFEKIVPRIKRLPSGEITMDPMHAFKPPVEQPAVDAGGSGLYSTAGDFIKVLRCLVSDDEEGEKLLGREIKNVMFTPQLQKDDALNEKLANWHLPKTMGFCEEWNFGLGGVIAVRGIEGRAGKGTMWWDGMPSCFWFVDRERGTCGFYGSQILPHDDLPTGELFREFQTALYLSDGGGGGAASPSTST